MDSVATHFHSLSRLCSQEWGCLDAEPLQVGPLPRSPPDPSHVPNHLSIHRSYPLPIHPPILPTTDPSTDPTDSFHTAPAT